MNTRYHLLGDSAYPISEHLLTPYRDYGNLTQSERSFNRAFCATRVKIENAFGLLKGRFRQLNTTEFLTVCKTSHFIIACCVLHNICIDNDDLFDVDFDELPHDNVGQVPECTMETSKREGELKRDHICKALNM